MVIGDSLTAGYGLPKADGFTSQLEVAMQDYTPTIKIINAGVSGDTSRGNARLDWLLAKSPIWSFFNWVPMTDFVAYHHNKPLILMPCSVA